MEWKAEYGLILFFAFAGVTYRLTQSKDERGGTVLQRIYAQFYAFLFTGIICVGIFSMLLSWHLVWASLGAILISPVAEHFCFLWMQRQNSSGNILQFIKRFRQTWNAIDKNSTNDDKPEQS